MIRSVRGNLLRSDAQALVNTVNTVGVMGKGIALEFKRSYPDMFTAYAAACRRREVRLGAMHLHRLNTLTDPQLIVNFPTKGHWREPSKLDDIRAGLASLVELVAQERVNSIAVPPLGCGNGGLDWRDIRPLIVDAFTQLPSVDVQLYEPSTIARDHK